MYKNDSKSMNLAQLYSLSSGQKLDRIYTNEKFYPLPFEKFIVFHPISKPSKCFDLWDEVLDIIKPELDKNDIHIVQVGGKNEKAFDGCYHTEGTTNYGQLQFLISKAQLVLTTDTISSHLAGHYDKKRIVLISNNFKDCVKPYFGTPENEVIFEPDRTKKNPTFSLDEGSNKQINEINPEAIAESTLKLLGLNYNYPFKTLYFGPLYLNRNIEGIPDQTIDIRQFGIPSLLLRMDVLFNEAALLEQAKISKVSIVTNKPVNLKLLEAIKPQLQEIYYELDSAHDPEFVEAVINLGVKIHLFSYLPPEKIQELKIHYYEFGVIHSKTILNPAENKELSETYKKEKQNLYYKSHKFILSNGKIFPSLASYKSGFNIPGFQHQILPIIDTQDYWKDWESHYFLKKIT